MPVRRKDGPSWDRLFETASTQEGLFTTQQALEAGYSLPLLVHHVQNGKVSRVRRGIYRLVHFPPGEHEDLVSAWLWSERAGPLSHETALNLHGLSDVLPPRIHLTVPTVWRRRRLRVPSEITLHYADVSRRDQGWVGPVPVTSPSRTLNDCAQAELSPELLRQAAREAIRRGMVRATDLADVSKALEPFGGLAA
jgi:predicted transcriptional regulator of viral defense system